MEERDSGPEVGVGPLHNMGENVENSVRIFQMSNIHNMGQNITSVRILSNI